MHPFDPAIFDSPTASLEELISAVKMQPSQAWRLYSNPVFVLKAIRGELGDLQARLGPTIMTEIASQHEKDPRKMANVSSILTRGDILAACSVAHEVPSRSMVTDAIAALGRTKTLTQLGACLGILSRHPAWESQDWATAAAVIPERIHRTEFHQAVLGLSRMDAEPQSWCGRLQELHDDEAGFLATTSADVEIISVLSLHDRAAVMITFNRQAPDHIIGALALLGPAALRNSLLERLRTEGKQAADLFSRPSTPTPASEHRDSEAVPREPIPKARKKPPGSGVTVPIKDLL